MTPDHAHRNAAGPGHRAAFGGSSLTWIAAVATLHCLTGCAIGEVLGMVVGTAIGLGNTATVVLAIVLAFFFGYALSTLPLLRTGLSLAVVAPLALASDTFSIAVMEVVDNTVMVTIPGAMGATLADWLFWGALGLALAVAFVAAWPVNRYLIARGRGHAVMHELHHGGHAGTPQVPALDVRRLVVVGAAAVLFTIGVGIAGATLAGRSESPDMTSEIDHGSQRAF
jgi:hypothetical protein